MRIAKEIVWTAAMCAGLGMSVLSAPAQEKTATPATAPATQPSTAPASPTVATVNGKDLSEADLNVETRTLQQQYARQIPPEQMAQYMPQLRQQAMQNMVSKELILQDAQQKKVSVSEPELKQAMAQYTANVPPGQTLETELSHGGVSMQEFQRQLTDNLLLEKILKDATSAVSASDEDASKFYTEHPEQFKTGETVSARHILVMFAPTDDAAKKAEKKAKIDGIRERLIKGEDFAKVCAETSQDPGSKDKGGLYENFPRGQMVPPFDAAAFGQKVGEIGPIVETSFGYHVIKVEKHTQAGVMALADVKDRLKTFLLNKKKQEVVQKLIGSLRDKAKITYAPGQSAPAPIVK